MKTTISLIKADVGSSPGHVKAPEFLLKSCEETLRASGILIDSMVTRCGDDIELIMTHTLGTDNEKIHKLAWDAFKKAAELAKEKGLYGAGQDLLKDAFSGNVRGMGPGIAEMEIEERKAEPIIVFMMDKTAPSAFSLPLFEMFANPFSTAGLVLDPKLHDGFRFEVHDVKAHKKVFFDCPEEMYDLLALIGVTSRYAIKRVFKKNGEIAAVASTEKLSFIAGEYVGKDDPAGIVRAQSGFPAVGEVLEPFAKPFFVPGWMRGSHVGPLMPCSVQDANPSRFDGPPRVIALGFMLKNGKIVEPKDLLGDISFDRAREQALEMADIMRRHGPFMPHLLPEDELEYTTIKKVQEKLKDRFTDI